MRYSCFRALLQRRAESARMFGSVAWIRLFVLDHRDESCKGEFLADKTQTCLTTFSTRLRLGAICCRDCFACQYSVQILMLPIKMRPVNNGAVRA